MTRDILAVVLVIIGVLAIVIGVGRSLGVDEAIIMAGACIAVLGVAIGWH